MATYWFLSFGSLPGCMAMTLRPGLETSVNRTDAVIVFPASRFAQAEGGAPSIASAIARVTLRRNATDSLRNTVAVELNAARVACGAVASPLTTTVPLAADCMSCQWR